jgi:hypothetical protein
MVIAVVSVIAHVLSIIVLQDNKQYIIVKISIGIHKSIQLVSLCELQTLSLRSSMQMVLDTISSFNVSLLPGIHPIGSRCPPALSIGK